MATMQFTADVNKTITVDGNIFTLTVPDIPDGLQLYVNEVEVTSGETVELTADMTLTFTAEPVIASKMTVNHSNMSTVTYNGVNVISGQEIEVLGEVNTLDLIGATTIPPVQINGDGVNSFTVNGTAYIPSDLPFTFTPQGGMTSQIFVNGNESEQHTITIAGTDIETMTINNVDTPLPYSATVTEDITIGVSGKIYQVDMSSVGGAKVVQNGVIISDGNNTMHTIIDIDKDTYIELDGTHTLTLDGEYIKSVVLNGVGIPIENLPAILKNKLMNVTLSVNGFFPSEVHISGHYINTATLDGNSIPVDDHGNIDIEFETIEDNHFITVIGSQPREYGVSWDDHGTTSIFMDGKKQISETTSLISKDIFVEAFPEDIPIHIESDDTVTIEINGRRQSSNDFTFFVSELTELDITSHTCRVTIDYIDGSYNIVVPQNVVTLGAPHRDGWIFDGWSSNTVGINNPKSVRTTIDFTGHSTASITCHYQKGLSWNKPNQWN